MSGLSLDGKTSVIGTEFIKLLISGSSDLATEEYVDTQISEGLGSSSAGTYTKAETDASLNTKLNVNNPDVSGNWRVSTAAGEKLIINATAPIYALKKFW